MRVESRIVTLVVCSALLTCSASTATAVEIHLDPQVAAQLKNGDTAVRQKIIRELFVEPKQLLKLDDSFLEAFMAGADDPDQGVRHTCVALIGERWIWKGGEQEPQAVTFLLQRSHTDEEEIRYACIYYGLSAMRPMSEAVVDRLIELAVEKGRRDPHALFGRVLWGFRSNRDSAAPRLQAYLDHHDGKDSVTAIRAMNLFLELTDRVPARLEKFADTGEYVITFSPQPPFLPKTKAEVKEQVLAYVKDPTAINELEVVLREGKFYGFAKVDGMPAYQHLQNAMRASGRFEISIFGLANVELDAFVRKMLEPPAQPKQISYEQAFRELYETLGKEYPCFELKEIDWQAVGQELLPISQTLRTQDEFALLCQRLIARLEDSHAQLLKGSAQPAIPALPRWSAGFACLEDDLGQPVVYFVNSSSPAESAGLQVGMTIKAINGQPAAEALQTCMNQYREYLGFSSDRLLRYQATRWFSRQSHKNAAVKITATDTQGQDHEFEMLATQSAGYLPRLPVPKEGIADAQDVSWQQLEAGIGYLYVRRIRRNLIADLDQAVADLSECRGLIIDVRGNSGGGFDAARSFRNFDLEDQREPTRPRFNGPIAVLIDARCISAGEGWASWFVANQRARLFGAATAGASARKKTIAVADGMFRARFPVKAYRGFLDRPLERRGIEPDVSVRQNAKDLAQGTDTVLEAAREYLRKHKQ